MEELTQNQPKDIDALHGFYQRAMQLNAKQQQIIEALRGKLKERDAEIDALEEQLVQAMEMGALEVELLGQESVWKKKYFENEVARRD